MKKKTTPARNKPAKRSRPAVEHFLYTVGWSEDDEAYVARVAEFPSLAAHGDSQEAALRSVQQVVKAVLKDMAVSNEPTPQPLGKRSALLTEDYLEERAKRGSRKKFERALAKVRKVKPHAADRL